MSKKNLTINTVKKEINGSIVYEFTKICPICGKEYKTTSRHQKYCSQKCSKIASKRRRSSRKKYDRYKEESRLLSRTHSLAHSVADLLGLEKKCFITGSMDNLELHHIDGNPLNNSPDNLCYLTKEIHAQLHAGLSLSPVDTIHELLEGKRSVLLSKDQDELLSRFNKLINNKDSIA